MCNFQIGEYVIISSPYSANKDYKNLQGTIIDISKIASNNYDVFVILDNRAVISFKEEELVHVINKKPHSNTSIFEKFVNLITGKELKL